MKDDKSNSYFAFSSKESAEKYCKQNNIEYSEIIDINKERINLMRRSRRATVYSEKKLDDQQ